MLFDFGFNLSPSVEDIKRSKKPLKLANCEKRIKMISDRKLYTRDILALLRTELDLREQLKKDID